MRRHHRPTHDPRRRAANSSRSGEGQTASAHALAALPRVLASARAAARASGLILLACLTLTAFGPSAAAAQQPAPAPAETGAEAPAPVEVRDEVELTIEKLGPGNRSRVGDWAGVLVGYRDSALSQREIVLRITGIDRDEDPPHYQRTVVGDPERPRTAWLYAPLPSPSQADRVIVTAHEAIEADVPGGFRAGRVLGQAVIEPTRLVQAESPMIGVIGTRDAGLRQYGVSITGAIRHTPLGNAAPEVVSGLTTRDLPDRWQGLAPFEVIVWTRGGPDTDPNALDADRARALREWVERGGHLAIVLPPIGQTWTAGGGRNPLDDLLPAVRVERLEGVSLEPYRPLLTLREDSALPTLSVVHTLTPAPDATPAEASAVLAGPDGAPVVARRLVGQGMVTLIGIDIAADSLTDLDTLDAESIWHRVLGRRYALDTFDQIKNDNFELSAAVQQREVYDLDDGIERAIDFTGDAGKGVLLGLGVFALYWLVAGPLGFFLLSRAGHRSRAWIAFIATSALFTGLAWAGATILRPDSTRATHLTFIDGVHGSGTQTARSWLSVLIPSYGEATIALDGDNGSGLLRPWYPSLSTRGSGGFPDNRPYAIEARAPDTMTVPVRSTIKQVQALWSGPSILNLPRPAREPGAEGPAGLVLSNPEEGRVSGQLIHDLPGDLVDVKVVVVAGQRRLAEGDNIGPLWLPARVYSDTIVGTPWPAGERLDLAAVTQGTPGDRNAFLWLDDLSNDGRPRGLGADPTTVPRPIHDRVDAISFQHMIGRPDFLTNRGQGKPSPLPTVRDAHGLDLSRWFTQPCVIVIGQLEQTEGDLPIPLTVNGQTIPAQGRTIVRWVFPLDPAPPPYAQDESQTDAQTGNQNQPG